MQEWIAERRMAEARRLLVETNLPVEEVGRRVGYGDPTYVAQPFGTYTQPLLLANAARGVLPKVMITNSFPLAQVKELIASEHPWFRELAGPEWRLLELPTGHWPMFSRPDDLAELLIDIPPSEAPGIE